MWNHFSSVSSRRLPARPHSCWIFPSVTASGTTSTRPGFHAEKVRDTQTFCLRCPEQRRWNLHLDLTLGFACGETPVGDHLQVQPFLEPHAVHHTDDLKYQHVLLQVISCLENTNHTVGATFGEKPETDEAAVLQTLQMTLTFLARGSVQMNDMPRGAALELYTLQACG